jgi:hypothetical protein
MPNIKRLGTECGVRITCVEETALKKTIYIKSKRVATIKGSTMCGRVDGTVACTCLPVKISVLQEATVNVIRHSSPYFLRRP